MSVCILNLPEANGKKWIPHHPCRAHCDRCASTQHRCKMFWKHQPPASKKFEIQFFRLFDRRSLFHEKKSLVSNRAAADAARRPGLPKSGMTFLIDDFHADGVNASDP